MFNLVHPNAVHIKKKLPFRKKAFIYIIHTYLAKYMGLVHDKNWHSAPKREGHSTQKCLVSMLTLVITYVKIKY